MQSLRPRKAVLISVTSAWLDWGKGGGTVEMVFKASAQTRV